MQNLSTGGATHHSELNTNISKKTPKGDFFKKITKSYSEGNVEIKNGVECFKYDDFNFQKFFRYASEKNE